jgi:hypothetical protein
MSQETPGRILIDQTAQVTINQGLQVSIVTRANLPAPWRRRTADEPDCHSVK